MVKRNHIRWHNETVNLTIKKIPDDTYKKVKDAAAAQGRSLNAEIIRMMGKLADEQDRRKYIREHMEELQRFRAKMPKLKKGAIAKLIREDRDSH